MVAYVFYSFVASNSLIAILHMICSAWAFVSLYKPPSLDKRPEQSILRYFDAVLENATRCGLVRANDFDCFHFAYIMLEGEFRRNVHPEAVAKNHRQLIEYLYAYRLGVDFLEIYMDSKDAFVHELATVNMVGFWADAAWGVGLGAEVKLPGQLLTKLADKVGMGWAANTCIGLLQASMPKWTDKLAGTRNRSGGRLLDCLADIIDDSSSRSLSIVRTLLRLYEQLCEDEQKPSRPFTDADPNLVPKLRNLARKARLQRLRVQAAYLLLMMEQYCEASIISAIEPTLDTYWFKPEVGMLELLLQHTANAPAFEYPSHFSTCEDPTIRPPPWARVSSSNFSTP
ncbi:hypothetical protein GOP47_0025156 [Adiantum capillus-veneris]|uniref:Uncharacterized protein n=1 Tax=Adiantum capillus-veneris TaxID=13818 RepID=A0A9D4U5Q3_ADICA|nr:hypothetical protein GOP47_0025156 [Adiantum capillus-veneris]